jgi:hypothetical protein
VELYLQSPEHVFMACYLVKLREKKAHEAEPQSSTPYRNKRFSVFTHDRTNACGRMQYLILIP